LYESAPGHSRQGDIPAALRDGKKHSDAMPGMQPDTEKEKTPLPVRQDFRRRKKRRLALLPLPIERENPC